MVVLISLIIIICAYDHLCVKKRSKSKKANAQSQASQRQQQQQQAQQQQAGTAATGLKNGSLGTTSVPVTAATTQEVEPALPLEVEMIQQQDIDRIDPLPAQPQINDDVEVIKDIKMGSQMSVSADAPQPKGGDSVGLLNQIWTTGGGQPRGEGE